MNSKWKKSGFLVSVIFAIVFLSMSVNLVSAMNPIKVQGLAWCYILPGKTAPCTEMDIDLEFVHQYCSNCPIELAMAFCYFKPTPGLSGCPYADEKCAEWINDDKCDWTKGVHICKGVCSDVSSLAYCSQVAAQAAAAAKAASITVPSFSGPYGSSLIELLDYVPLQGCCKEDSACNYDGTGTAVCRKGNRIDGTSSQCPIWVNNTDHSMGVKYYNKQCCRVTNGKCTSAADCCNSNNKCINGICTTTIIGDINGDCKVDIKDLTLVIKYYGTYPGRPLWNPNADINFDNKVDIKDLTLVNKYYGTSCSGTGTRRLGLIPDAVIVGIVAIAILVIIFGILKLTKKKR
jgi:hypothetical protein